MANNTIPSIYESVIQMLTEACEGARLYGEEAGLKQNDAAALRAMLEALAGAPAGPEGDPPAREGLKAASNVAKTQKTARAAALRNIQSEGRALAMACVGTLKPRLGNQWSPAWQPVGFASGSLQVAANPLVVLQYLRTCYANHPEWEVPNLTPTLSCTALACQTAADAITAAQTASTLGNLEASQARERLTDGVKAARSRLSGLREELARLIPSDDHRWYAFGFNRPIDVGSPDIPTHLILVPGAAGSGMVFADWDDMRRADGYRVRVTDAAGQVLAEFLTQDSEATLTGLPSGQTVTVQVSARNGTGESRMCEGVGVAVP